MNRQHMNPFFYHRPFPLYYYPYPPIYPIYPWHPFPQYHYRNWYR